MIYAWDMLSYFDFRNKNIGIIYLLPMYELLQNNYFLFVLVLPNLRLVLSSYQHVFSN